MSKNLKMLVNELKEEVARLLIKDFEMEAIGKNLILTNNKDIDINIRASEENLFDVKTLVNGSMVINNNKSLGTVKNIINACVEV